MPQFMSTLGPLLPTSRDTPRLTRRQVSALSLGGLLAAVAPLRAAEPGAVVYGDYLPQNLDPHQVLGVLILYVSLNAYDTLFRYQGPTPEQVPWLAESYEVSPDGLLWTVRLRQNVRFHDGSELTSADVVYSFKRLLGIGKAPAGPLVAVLKPDNILAPDKRTVTFRLESPYEPFFSTLPLVAIVNASLVKQHEQGGDWAQGWLASNEAGSGAYSMVPDSYQPQERVQLERFPAHFAGWNNNPSPIPRLDLHAAKETSTRVMGILNGSIDVTDGNLPADQAERIAKSSIARLERNPTMRTFLIRMNNTKPPFDNLNARKCFAHAFNYPGFIDQIMKGQALRNGGPMPKGLWGNPPDLQTYDYDLDKARFYLKTALAEGAPMTRPIQFLGYAISEQSLQAGEVFQADLDSLGLNVRVVNSQWPAILASTAHAETAPDIWVHWVSTYFVDPENWVGQMYDSRFHGTWKASSYYKNPQVDAWLEQARTLVKKSDRAPLYEKAITQIVADCPDIWIYDSIELRGISKRIANFRFCPVGGGTEARTLQLAT